jgi:hypothetical protein
MTSAERQRRFIARREAKAAAKAEARPDPYGLGPIVQVEAFRQQPAATASWLRGKLGDHTARVVHAALGQAIEDAESGKPAGQAGATDAEARALDAAIARLEAEVPSVPMLPRPGQWCAALSISGVEAIVRRLVALRVRIERAG